MQCRPRSSRCAPDELLSLDSAGGTSVAGCRNVRLLLRLLSFPKVFFSAARFKLTFHASRGAWNLRNAEKRRLQPTASVRLVDQSAQMTFGKLCKQLLHGREVQRVPAPAGQQPVQPPSEPSASRSAGNGHSRYASDPR